MAEESRKTSEPTKATDLAIFGCLVAGILAFCASVAGLVEDQLMSCGVCCIAAALAFGIVVFVSFRD
jgi:hypothetical protein